MTASRKKPGYESRRAVLTLPVPPDREDLEVRESMLRVIERGLTNSQDDPVIRGLAIEDFNFFMVKPRSEHPRHKIKRELALEQERAKAFLVSSSKRTKHLPPTN